MALAFETGFWRADDDTDFPAEWEIDTDHPSGGRDTWRGDVKRFWIVTKDADGIITERRLVIVR